MSTDRAREVRAGLARTRRYLLAHHEPGEWDRCHTIRLPGTPVRLCARCSGVYPGIAGGVALALSGTATGLWPWLVALGPLPALVDWAATTLGGREGSNAVRTLTGVTLGAAYGVAVPWLLTAWPLWLVAVAAGYGALAAAGLRASGDLGGSDGERV